MLSIHHFLNGMANLHLFFHYASILSIKKMWMGYAVIRFCGYLVLRLLFFTVVGLCGCWVLLLLGFAVVGLCGCWVLRLLGFTVVVFYGC